MSYEVTVTHLSGSKRNAVETFSALPVLIGRTRDCQLRFDAEEELAVSACHAEIRAGDDGLEIEDLQSKNGVFVNGERVQGAAALPNHAVVELGRRGKGPRFQLTYEAGSAGISFTKLRRPVSGETNRPAEVPPTEEIPAVTESELGLVEDFTTNPGNRTVAIVILVLVVLVALVFLIGSLAG